MTRPRDSQHNKVLEAFLSMRPLNPTLEWADLQHLATRLIKQVWFARRTSRRAESFAIVFVPVVITNCSGTANFCQLGTQERDTLTFLHKLAHYMLPDDVALHGPEFAKLMLELVHHVGLDPADTSPERRKADREALKAAWNTLGVKWRVYSDEARASARQRWHARDLARLHDELTEDAVK